MPKPDSLTNEKLLDDLEAHLDEVAEHNLKIGGKGVNHAEMWLTEVKMLRMRLEWALDALDEVRDALSEHAFRENLDEDLDRAVLESEEATKQ